MLVLTRRLGEAIFIGDNIRITVVDIDKSKMRFGIDAPPEVAIHREEIAPPGHPLLKPRPVSSREVGGGS